MQLISQAEPTLPGKLQIGVVHEILFLQWVQADQRAAYVHDSNERVLKVLLPKDYNGLSEKDIEQVNAEIDHGNPHYLKYHGLKSCADGKFQKHHLELID